MKPEQRNKEIAGSSDSETEKSMGRDLYFRIQLTVVVYKQKKLAYRNEMIVPTWYTRRSEARAHIKKEIQKRLRESDFFLSPRVDFDLVRYTNEATCNTYIRYRIVEEEGDILQAG